jgi:isoleucyl-tRNA synthetase
MADNPPKPDWRSSVFLPRTEFPMKAGLAAKEPGLLERWAKLGLYQRLREQRAGAERFILHDGPPYANGDLHMGHAMNKVLKDVIVRTQSLLGKDAPYIPGWDCHGLPIEWKVEEGYRARKVNVDKELDPVAFRAECRAYAAKWVGIQRDQFKRLGIMGDWDDPYLTMDFAAEAAIVGELLKFAETGQLYRGAKPVMWSPVEKTALAEAEVEYEDVTSTQIDVAFEITEAPNAPELVGAYAVIWTTTPWTIPTNQAIAYGEELDYVTATGTDGRRYVVATALLSQIEQRIGGGWSAQGAAFKGGKLAGAIARHPMHARGGFFARPRPFLAGHHVTTDAGTGLVHIAPDHGEDDFLLGKEHGIDPVFAVEANGFYREDWAWMGGQGSVIAPKLNAAEGPICSDLREAGALLSAGTLQHSYPHSWRSKARVIFRCTPQWFIAMDRQDIAIPRDPETAAAVSAEDWEGPKPPTHLRTLRQTALEAIAATRWVPSKGENRIRAMVEDRPDWVVSRQRAWGVPIALYVNRQSGEHLVDHDVNARIVEAFKAGGADAWFTADHQALLGERHKAADYEPVNDILDVWFDSGSTHSFVVEARYGKGVRADLYLEGSDQHRGWFQSSLLESCGTRGRAPYKGVLTHGFALDAQGRKMSKSLGNVVDPARVIAEGGADILRMWVCSTDYFEDVRIGKEILAGTTDAYRKLRNSLRYLLGALDGFTEEERVAPAEMPELERWILHRLAAIDGDLRAATDGFEFNRYLALLTGFANDELSALLFDVRKDCLYCDAPASLSRRAYRSLLDILFHALVRWVAPILCFTAEEAWQTRFPSDTDSIHLQTWPLIDPAWRDDELAARWDRLRAIRSLVTAAIEPLRRDKVIGSSLEAEVDVAVDDLDEAAALAATDLATLFISSTVRLLNGASPAAGLTSPEVPGIAVTVRPTELAKCGRCWRLLPEVEEDGDLCDRCAEVVHG